MKKIFALSLIVLFFLTGCSNKLDNSNANNNFEENTSNQIGATQNESPQYSKVSIPPEEPKEEEIGKYSTKIYDKSEARQNNLRITCSKINNYEIPSGATFSFCDTVGKASPQAGYQKAKIFDKDGHVEEGYGGRKLPSKHNSI